MKLREILDRYNNPETVDILQIQYRTKTPDGLDLLAGVCHWNRLTDELISDDGNSYSFDDEIYDYEIWLNPTLDDADLVVWYKAEWISQLPRT